MNKKENDVIEGLIERFTPLIMKTARRYEGRGAEREDLEQEGRLALIVIASACAGDDIRAMLASRLPAMVRDAAERMTRRGRPGRPQKRKSVSLSETATDGEAELGETIEDPCAARMMEGAELAADIERSLTPEEMDIARSLAMGMTYDEIARREGVTRQAVWNRVRRMRRKLSGIS